MRAETEPFSCSPCLYCQELCHPGVGPVGLMRTDAIPCPRELTSKWGPEATLPESAAQIDSRQTNCGVLEGA